MLRSLTSLKCFIVLLFLTNYSFSADFTVTIKNIREGDSVRIIVQKKNIVMGKKEDDITKDILELVDQKIKTIKLD